MKLFRAAAVPILASLALGLAACATPAEVRMTSTLPGPPAAATYALQPPSDPGAALAVPAV